MGASVLVVDDSPTIRKVVISILETREFATHSAADGVEALEKLQNENVDLVLLDFVMPRMNGYQFCRELRADPDHRELPVVLMSAKGDKIRGQFVQQTGAIDAITKPFDARGLIAVVEGALNKHREGRGRPVPEPGAMPEEETIADALAPSSSEFYGPNSEQLLAADKFADGLKRLLGGNLDDLSSTAKEAVFRAIEVAITVESVPQLLSELEGTELGHESQSVLAGDISVISIAEILQLLHLQRQSGTLTVESGRRRILLHIGQGNIDLAASRGVRDEFLLGRYLVESGSISRTKLDEVLVNRSAPGLRLGQRLIDAGLVEEDAVKLALTRQSSELVYEVVRWKAGRFVFQIGLPPPEGRLNLSIGALIMEGFRRVDEWRLIEGTFDFEDILMRDEVALDNLGDAGELTQREKTVLAAIDGKQTVREIADTLEGSSFEVCKIIYQFVNSRLVRRASNA